MQVGHTYLSLDCSHDNLCDDKSLIFLSLATESLKLCSALFFPSCFKDEMKKDFQFSQSIVSALGLGL